LIQSPNRKSALDPAARYSHSIKWPSGSSRA
jgi:hypothetical protein